MLATFEFGADEKMCSEAAHVIVFDFTVAAAAFLANGAHALEAVAEEKFLRMGNNSF
jgi:hypothetical protein